MSLVRFVALISVVAFAFTAAQLLLDKYTIAASVTQRIVGTEFKGVTPDSRVGVWGPVVQRALQHPLIGHGPYYDTGKGLVRIFWPHNGYLFYFYTLGLFGLSAFLVIVYRLMRSSLRYYHPLAAGTFLGLATAIFNVQLVEFLVAQMRTDHQRTTDSIYMYIAWLIFALIAASGNMLRKREAEEAGSRGGIDVEPVGTSGIA
jgi:O-antigen ligase